MTKFKKIIGSLWLCFSILGASHAVNAESIQQSSKLEQNPFDNIEQMTTEVIVLLLNTRINILAMKLIILML